MNFGVTQINMGILECLLAVDMYCLLPYDKLKEVFFFFMMKKEGIMLWAYSFTQWYDLYSGLT